MSGASCGAGILPFWSHGLNGKEKHEADDIASNYIYGIYQKRNGEVHEKGLQREPDLGRVVREGFMEEVPLELNPNTF